jgi:ssDNA-binding replication factor A large subunit
MTHQQIIENILSKHSELTNEKIFAEFELEKQKNGNLIEEKTLWRMIGARYGVESNRKTTFNGKLSISDLISGLYNVSIKGRIVAVYPIKSFQGDKPGKFANLIISDKNAIIRVILWNEKTGCIDSNKIVPGDIILVSQGYTREDSKGKVELHVGKKSEIKILKTDVNLEDYPSIKKFSKKISEITPDLSEVHIIGAVKKIFPIKTFFRNDSSEGLLLRFILYDETGEIPVVAWNKQAEKIKRLIDKNSKLKLVNAKINLASDKSLELHINSYTYFDLYSEK